MVASRAITPYMRNGTRRPNSSPTTPPANGPMRKPARCMPAIPVICRPRWFCEPVSAITAKRVICHICCAMPPMTKYTRSSL